MLQHHLPWLLQRTNRLRTAGLELAALTNSPPDIANAQLVNAGLASLFDHILTVHPTGYFKPHRDVYHHAAREIERPLPTMMMVAAHDWDIAGAMSAGMKGAYVTRPGMAANPLFEEPTVLAPDLEAATTAILRLLD